MLLYAVGLGGDQEPDALGGCVAESARPFRHLDESTLDVVVSPSGRLTLATLGHAPGQAAPRRYVARRGSVVTAFDGLPLAPPGTFGAWDANALLDHWSTAPDTLDGQFSAVRLDLERDGFDCITDALGLHPLYVQKLAGGWAVSNSVEVLRLLSRVNDPDPLGVSSFLSLGWAVGHRTLLAPVKALTGGCAFSFGARGVSETRLFTPDVVVGRARADVGREETQDLVDSLVGLTAATVADGGLPVKCAVTAGRDTRVVLALCLAAGITPETATMGAPEDIDVALGSRVAAYAGLTHRALPSGPAAVLEDVDTVARDFVSLTDGLASLLQVDDIGDLYEPSPERVGVQAWGVGGEIARSGTGRSLRGFAANTPLLSRSPSAQMRLLFAKVQDPADILKSDVHVETRAYLDRFGAARLDEGWRPHELGELFYTFERVARWGSTGIRRATAVDDLYTPFATRPFVEFAFRLRPGDRFVESAHWRILSCLDGRLRDLPFERPWRTQRRRAAPALAVIDGASQLADRVDVGRRLGRRPAAHATGVAPPRRFAFDWLDRHRARHREVCLSDSSSPLWEWIDRAKLERALSAEAVGAAGAEGLLRAVTLGWYFHGR